MSNENWTPGPWYVRTLKSGECFVEAKSQNPEMPYNVDICGEDYYGHGDEEQREINMHLIAAAPEMYEALRALRLAVNSCAPDAHEEVANAEAMARDVMAKARGEKS